MPPASPRVFISYSHDDRAHCDRVLAFAQQLRCDGVDAELDQFHQEELLHWPRWCEEQMRPGNADFVLCVCTAEYARRIEGETPADVGRGVFWEGTLIYNELYDAKGNRRFVLVLLGEAKEDDIPHVLKNHRQFRLDRFGLDDTDYAKLYRLLTRQAGVAAEALGALVALPPLPEAPRLTDFDQLIHDLRAGLVDIHQDTQAIRREQAQHGEWLQRIDRAVRGYRYDRALHQLKTPPQHFTGRAGPLAEICAALSPGNRDNIAGSDVIPAQAVVISAVNGLPGVGKTALAIMAGYALLDDYPDLQLFLELGAHSAHPLSAEQARDSVLQAVNPTARLPDDEASRWQRYRSLFRDADSGAVLRGLVVLDDAADDAQITRLAPPPGCALLATSRQRLRHGQPLHLDRLPRAEAKLLLRAYTQRPDDAQAGRLAALCGDLPVALKTAGGYLKTYPSTPVAEYLAELGEDRLQGLRNDEEPLDDVNLVFDASWRRLNEAERRAFAALAVMTADFDRAAGKAVVESTRPEGAAAAKALDRLVNLNLLDYDEERQRFGWHDLLRDYALAHLPADQAEAARLGHAEHFIAVAEQSQALYLQGHEHLLQGLALFDQERAHLEAVFGFLQSDSHRAKQLLHLVDCVAHTGELRFHPYQRIHWLQAQEVVAQQTGNRQHECNALGNIGNVYYSLGEPSKAIRYYEQVLSISHEIDDQHSVGNALGNLGPAYTALGEPRKAVDYCEQALFFARKISNQHSEGKILGNMGIAYKNLGETHKAIGCHEQNLAIACEIGDRRGEGSALGNLGVAYRDLGEPGKAIGYFEQQLTIADEIGDRRGKASALGNMGNFYSTLDEPSKAIGYHEQHLAIALEIADRRGEGAALGNLGNAYFRLGEPHRAIGYYKQQLAIAHEIGDRRGEGRALWNSALACEALGERAQALPLAQQALAIYEAIEDPNAATVREMLAQWQGGDEAAS